MFAAAVVVVEESGCFAGAGISPPTGVVPGAGVAVGVAAGVFAGAGVEDDVVVWPVLAAGAFPCAQMPVASASVRPVITAALKPM